MSGLCDCGRTDRIDAELLAELTEFFRIHRRPF
jgi:hypothetical protein